MPFIFTVRLAYCSLPAIAARPMTADPRGWHQALLTHWWLHEAHRCRSPANRAVKCMTGAATEWTHHCHTLGFWTLTLVQPAHRPLTLTSSGPMHTSAFSTRFGRPGFLGLFGFEC